MIKHKLVQRCASECNGILYNLSIHSFKHYTTIWSHKKKQKAYSSCYTAIASPCTNTGMPGATQILKPCAASPRLVTHRRTVQVSQIEVKEPTVRQQPNTAKWDKDRFALLPGTHWCYSWAVSPVDTRSPQGYAHTYTHTQRQMHTQIQYTELSV